MTRARDVANLIGSGNYSSTTFTATAGQTAFTISHTQGFIQVFMNGLLLDETVDYTSNGSAVTLTSGAAAGDEIEVVAYNTFSVGDALNQAAADTRYVNATGDTVTGGLAVDSGNGDQLTLDNDGERFTQISLKNNGSQYAAVWYDNSINVLVNHAASGKGYVVQTGGSTDRLVIDSSGRVTMPSQIGFSYLGSRSHVISTTGTQVMSSSNVWSANVNHAHNRGSHFDASTGRFTCPIAGRYQFHFRCQASNFGSGYLWFYMRLNQSVFSYSQKSQENAHTTQYLGGILELNANDYVDVAWTNNYVSGQIHYPEFTGYLIG